jgi:hypothetical protein
MPYIKPENREPFIKAAKEIANQASNAGDLNFAITYILHSFLKKKGINYANLNEVHGMMDCCNKELYRRVTAVYEDSKIVSNTDVGVISQADLDG